MNIAANSSIMLALAATVILSVLGHGIGAKPTIKLYARTIAGPGPDAQPHWSSLPQASLCPEQSEGTMPTRA